MKKYFRDNGLSLVFLGLFFLSLAGQVWTGFNEYNKERREEGMTAIGLPAYFSSGHFLEATFENWESEFLQMALFVVLTISFRQKGSSESKQSRHEDVDRQPSPRRKGAPWPVRKEGFVLWLYERSLSITLFGLFLVSFILHWLGSLKDENEQHLLKGIPPENAWHYLATPRFWFESFQNWQSEFLSVFAIIILSIYLRQKGSPQSKPVDMPNSKGGK